MNIIDTLTFFKNLQQNANDKREIKIYDSFISILSNLESREFSELELAAIENQIQSLQLDSNPEKKKRYYRKKLGIFKQFLQQKFSLVPEGHFTALGMSLGMCFGIALGSAFGTMGTSMGLLFGMVVGLIIGQLKDKEAEKNNRVLKKNLNS